MAIQILTQISAGTSNRYELQKGDTVRMPSSCPSIRVLSGRTWISRNGEDTVLGHGEEIRFSPCADYAVISPLRTQSLTFEVLDKS